MVKKTLYFCLALVSLSILSPISLFEVFAFNLPNQNREMNNFNKIINEISNQSIQKKISTKRDNYEFAQTFQLDLSSDNNDEGNAKEPSKPTPCCMKRKKGGGRWKKTGYSKQECRTRNSSDKDNLLKPRGLIYWNQNCPE